ncbi:transcription initiation protein spt4 [Hysterangium stoloniferum]|nr:transcription initiation protein spt4 [Hysterangium stoloniferum]
MASQADATAAIPSNARSRQLRACLLCSIVQTPADFKRHGCPNCEEILQLKIHHERLLSCTSGQFDGIIAVIDPENSWVARWQRTSKYVRGMYAARVSGRIPDEIEEDINRRHMVYRPRDETGE